jgi:hypothetical protein
MEDSVVTGKLQVMSRYSETTISKIKIESHVNKNPFTDKQKVTLYLC